MDMNCNVVQDLLPLYIDDCCSADSAAIVKEHLAHCPQCQAACEKMRACPNTPPETSAPVTFSRVNTWRASVLQSTLLFVSFGLVALGVALEAATPLGLMNGFWAFSLVIPATGFLLSLANWYFVRLYPSRKAFSRCSLLLTLGLTLCGYVWAGVHYGLPSVKIVAADGLWDLLSALAFHYGIGVLLTAAGCVLSKVLSDLYGKMLGKE